MNQLQQESKRVDQALIHSNQRMSDIVESIRDALITLDYTWRITFANSPAAALIGAMPEQQIGQNIWEKFSALVGTPLEKHFRKAMTERIPVSFEADGRGTSVKYEIRVYPSAEGIAVYGIDITERKQVEEQLKQANRALKERTRELDAERARWQGVVEGIADEVWVCDATGRMSLINLPVVTPMGLREFENKSVEEIYQEVDILTLDGQMRPPEDAPLLRSLRGEVVRGEEIMRDRKTGKTRYRQYSSAPIRNASGEITGAVAIVRDSTDIKHAQAEIEMLARFTDDNPHPVLRVSGAGTILYANATATPLLNTWQCAVGGLLPEYWRALVSNSLENAKTQSVEMEAQGNIFELTIVPILHDGYANLYGINITQRKRAQNELAWVNEQLEDRAKQLEQRSQKFALLNEMGGMFESCPTVQEAHQVIAQFGEKLFDDDCGALYAISNSRDQTEAVATWGAPRTRLTQTLFKPEECWALRRGQLHLVTNLETGLVCQHVKRNIEPSENASTLCIPMLAQGEVLGLFYLQSQPYGISTEKQRLAETVAEHLALALGSIQLRETLQQMAIRDPLTGLFNRRYFAETLERELHRAKRHASQVGILMIDVDHFKSFNDAYGHPVGDAVLRSLAHKLASHVRKEDIVCRYGGEEFAVILTDTTMAETAERAEELRQEIERIMLTQAGQSFRNITASFGVAIFPQHGETPDQVLRASDSALYQAKTSGRNRVVMARSKKRPR